MQYPRAIQATVEAALTSGKAIIIYGARQVGKTTLVREIMAAHEGAIYLNCDEPAVRTLLTERGSAELRVLLGHDRLVVMDEAQRVPGIGLTIKLIVDNLPDLKVLATGSSSFALAGGVREAFTGRKREFTLYPLALDEWYYGQRSGVFARVSRHSSRVRPANTSCHWPVWRI